MVSLNQGNWLIWNSKMEDIIFCKELYEPIEESKLNSISEEEWKKVNR